MKYTYVSTYALPTGIDGNWTTYENPDQGIWELIDQTRYQNVYIKILEEGELTPFYIHSDQLLSIPRAILLTLSDLFKLELDTDIFYPEDHVPTELIQYVAYHDAEKLNYAIYLDCQEAFVSPNLNRPPTNDIPNDTPLSELPDLLLTNVRRPIDVSSISKNCLVFVNGLLHQTSASVDSHIGVFIKGGGKTSNLSGFTKVGLINFESAGGITTLALSSLTVAPENGNEYYGTVNILDIPIDLSNQQILLSLGGYLIFPELNVLTIISSHSVSLYLPTMMTDARIVESSKYIDLSSLGLEDLVPDDEQADTSILRRPDVLSAFIGLPQSFLIIIPKPNITVYQTYFRRYNNERCFETHYEPKQIIVSKTGRLLNYWSTLGKYGYTVDLLDFKQVINTTTSSLYKKLVKAYPKLTPVDYSIKNFFLSIGFFDDP